MDLLEILRGEYLSIFFGGLAGIVTAWLTQRVLNKRGVFSYFVTHHKVGVSTNDSIFGNVLVTWNGNPVQHLFLSTLELRNESLNDYENVTIQTFSSNTNLLSERTQIVDTPNILKWTDDYNQRILVPQGQKPDESQIAIYSGQREYLIPVFNRGQTVTISYLNAAKTDEFPTIWLSATVKGVRVVFREPEVNIFGVSQSRAALTGAFLSFVGIFPLVLFLANPWYIAFLAFTLGFLVKIPGALAIRLFRHLREVVGG